MVNMVAILHVMLATYFKDFGKMTTKVTWYETSNFRVAEYLRDKDKKKSSLFYVRLCNRIQQFHKDHYAKLKHFYPL